MGEVWQAVDEVLGRPVAVKLLLGSDADEQAAVRFRLEARTAARLNHPNVVTVFDFGAWNGRFYLVMELVEGVSLAADLAAGGVFSPRQVADIAAQAAAGLAAAHRQGVIHRDIKPGNLMQSADGTVKIGDFGIAQFVNDPSAALTSTGQIVGTSLYLAPERALGTPAGPGSDVYALGCVLYQLLVGAPPFQADTLTAVLHQHINAAPAPPSLRRPDLPDAFERYLLRMLAKQQEERPGAQQVAEWFTSRAWHGQARQVPTSDEPETATGYALPQTAIQPAAAGPRPRAPRGRQRAASQPYPQLWTDIRTRLRQHKTLASTAAGTAAFVATALLGAAVFSPGTAGARPPANPPSQEATQAPAAPAFPSLAASPNTTPTGGQTQKPMSPKNGKKRHG